jgi:hypothetical protein
MFCVLVGSVIDGWSKLDNCTGSIAEIRASDRASRGGMFGFDDVGSNVTVPQCFQANNVQLIGLLRLVLPLRCSPNSCQQGC